MWNHTRGWRCVPRLERQQRIEDQPFLELCLTNAIERICSILSVRATDGCDRTHDRAHMLDTLCQSDQWVRLSAPSSVYTRYSLLE
jgi:hypothetical protein